MFTIESVEGFGSVAVRVQNSANLFPIVEQRHGDLGL
jgi:hypothetical protein